MLAYIEKYVYLSPVHLLALHFLRPPFSSFIFDPWFLVMLESSKQQQTNKKR